MTKEFWFKKLDKSFETKRFILRNYKDTDFSDYAEIFFQSELMEAFGAKAYESDEQVEKSISWAKERRKNHIHFEYVLCNKETDRVIGTLGIKFKHFEKGVLELSYLLNSKFWRKGIMSECVKELIIQLLNIDGSIRIQGQYREDNKASAKLLEKCGFVFLQNDEICGEIYPRVEYKGDDNQ